MTVTRVPALALLLAALLVGCGGAEQSTPAPAEPTVEPTPAEAVTPAVPQPLRVLFIGNSYTFSHDLPAVLSQIAEAAGGEHPIETGMVAEPGATLEQHWQARRGQAEIRRGGWDVVVLQGHSLGTLQQREALFAVARAFDGEIRESGARTAFFMTWARRGRPEMLEAVRDGYTAIAEELGATLVPAGVAWQTSHERHPGLHLWHSDGSHPSPAGTYLAAALFYEVLTDCSSAVGVDHAGLGQLDVDEIRALQEIAHERCTLDRHDDPR